MTAVGGRRRASVDLPCDSIGSRTGGGRQDAVSQPHPACRGCMIESADLLGSVLREALTFDIPIDYSDNTKLMQDVHQDFIH